MSASGDFCILDENGLTTLPDGSTAPVVVEPDGSAFVIGADGTLTLIGEGASFIVEDEDTGDIQYDNEDGELLVPPLSKPMGSDWGRRRFVTQGVCSFASM